MTFIMDNPISNNIFDLKENIFERMKLKKKSLFWTLRDTVYTTSKISAEMSFFFFWFPSLSSSNNHHAATAELQPVVKRANSLKLLSSSLSLCFTSNII
jgi:hypothetical protein